MRVCKCGYQSTGPDDEVRHLLAVGGARKHQFFEDGT